MSAPAVVGSAGFAGSEITGWCPTCKDYAVPMSNGTCGFCNTQLREQPQGTPTELGDAPTPPPVFRLRRRRPRLPTERQRERREPLKKGDVGFGLVCACGGPKTKQAHSCKACWIAAGRPGAGGAGTPRPAMRGPYGISEDQMLKVRRMYEEEQVSIREAARRIHPETYGYSSVRSLSEAIYRGFRNRGWPIRSQTDAVKLRNWKHGLKQRVQSSEEQVAYRHWLAEQRGWRAVQGPGNPTCSAERVCHPRKGQPCARPASDGSEFCYSHDPARAAARAAHLEGARALIGRSGSSADGPRA